MHMAMTKGFALDNERLKQGKTAFGTDYFRELLEWVRSIRASERRIWQQITEFTLNAAPIMTLRPRPPGTFMPWAGDENTLLINDPRFAPAGVLAPKSKADLAFIMHSLSWLAANGTAAIVCFPGILCRVGAEKKIRQYLIDNNFIDCVIQLPSNLFFGTSIATCIMVLKKNKADNKTLFIDATQKCIKVTNNNKLTPENIDRIVDTFASRTEEAHFSHLASYEEIAGREYNLSVSTYIDKISAEIEVDA